MTRGGAFVNDENVTGIARAVDAKSVKDGSIILRAGKKRDFLPSTSGRFRPVIQPRDTQRYLRHIIGRNRSMPRPNDDV